MSEQRHASRPFRDGLESMVVRYLRDDPEFFDRHLELLEDLRIPHPCRPAVSLIERQLRLLREQNAQLRKTLLDLVCVARENDGLSERMQQLALALIEADGLDELLHGLKGVLRDEFNADFTALRLAARPLGAIFPPAQDFTSIEALLPFESVLRSGRPRCGLLTAEQARCLFEDAAPDIASATLIPLQGSGWNGVLAVGSRDSGRFHPGMGTLFLSRMAELVSHALGPHLGPVSMGSAKP